MTMAVLLWLLRDDVFYLFNFAYIGFFVSLGIFLSTKRYNKTRVFIEIFVGSYMLLYLGIISRENMQIEGFFYYVSMSTFQAAAIHYLVAKLRGRLLSAKQTDEKIGFIADRNIYVIIALILVCFYVRTG